MVDVEFPPEHLPEIYNALRIAANRWQGQVQGGAGHGANPDGNVIVAEVQQHLGNDGVRAVAMGPPTACARGIDAVDTGAPITVPVGPATLGRLFNVLGEPIDGKGPVNVRDRATRSTAAARASRTRRPRPQSSRPASRSST